jgi:hypothetical protein
MKRILSNLWTDDCGALLATEWVIMATIIVLGIIPGLVAIRNGLLHELKDVSNATTSLDQSYEFTGNVLVCPETDRAGSDTTVRRHVGNGSLTEVVVTSTNNRAGVKLTQVSTGRDGRPALVDGRDPFSQRRRIAQTAGSAFIQGNHTADGRELRTSVKSVDIRPLKQQAQTVAPADADE